MNESRAARHLVPIALYIGLATPHAGNAVDGSESNLITWTVESEAADGGVERFNCRCRRHFP